MAKKRSSRKSARRSREARQSSSNPVVQSNSAGGPVNLSEEYEYVLTDLRRIGILAAVLVAILVGLSFVL